MSTPELTASQLDEQRLTSLYEYLESVFGQDTVQGFDDGDIQKYWDKWQSKDAIGSGIRELYVQRDFADKAIAGYTDEVDTTIGLVKTTHSQRFSHWQQIRANIQAEINKLEDQAAHSRIPVVGQVVYRPTFVNTHYYPGGWWFNPNAPTLRY